MIKFIPSDPNYANDQASKNIWDKIRDSLKGVEGICYYKHPVIISATKAIPEITLLARDYQPLAIKCLTYSIDDIQEINEVTWTVSGQTIDSPFLELDDYIVGLQHKFARERLLRNKFKSISALALPLISRADFEARFGKLQDGPDIIWGNYDLNSIIVKIDKTLTDEEWRLAMSVFQGLRPLNINVGYAQKTANTMGGAIRVLSKQISLLDDAQHKVAVQIAPGPQQIRGLAGTGKTIVLAKKAANLHLRYPEKKILFTFHTQSLYNQTKSWLSQFYRDDSDAPPDWDNLHVKHSWGGKSRHGVYYDLCKMHNTTPLAFREAAQKDPKIPFRACCREALKLAIKPIYDYILVDEAQDFPNEYFHLLLKLVGPEKRIYWAYDQLQSLSAIKVPSTTERFGVDRRGNPLVSLEGEDYPGEIEKDLVLPSSYRCPQNVLMLAHGIGLGIHSPTGCVQMLDDKASWLAIGYEIKKGNLQQGEATVIFRPQENSPNRITEIYSGDKDIIAVKEFNQREDELNWVVDAIHEDITQEKVRPEDIVVISLDSRRAKEYLKEIQDGLFTKKINSTIPGLVDESYEFAEPNCVTLSTVHRAKGNEAPVIYIISFDWLYDYIEEIENRNKAFTSISRSKGWVRITGSGKQMQEVVKEIRGILGDIPRFRFTFPDMKEIPRLDAYETNRRRNVVKKARESINKLIETDKKALSSLDPDVIKKLKEVIEGINNDNK